MRLNRLTLKMLMTGMMLTTTVFFASAQTEVSSAPDHTAGSVELNINDLPLRSLRLPNLSEVGGSIYMNRDFVPAEIRLKDGGVVKNIPVKFNMYNNALMVKKDGSEWKVEPFESATYTEYNTAGEPKQITFRTGYPEVDNHIQHAIYQVLAYGSKVQLLKYYTQKVEDAPTLGDYSRRELATSQQLYIYVHGGEIKKISLGKKAISGSFPSLAEKADEIVKEKNLNLKNESDLIQLIDELNKR